jgi:hypothetical protein
MLNLVVNLLELLYSHVDFKQWSETPAPLQKEFPALVKYLEQEGARVCDRIAQYSKLWKQPMNVEKTVAQIL